MRGYMGAMQPDGGMPELLKRQIDRLETAIDLSTDWLRLDLMVELDQLKALYEEAESESCISGAAETSASEHNPSSSATRQASLFGVIDPTNLPAWESDDVPWHE